MIATSGQTFDKRGLQVKRKESVRIEGTGIETMTVIEKVDVNPECREGLTTIDVTEIEMLKVRMARGVVVLEEAATSHLGIRMKVTRKRADMKTQETRDLGIGRGGVRVDKTEIGIEGE